MYRDNLDKKRVFGGLLLMGAAACLLVAGCGDIQPEPNEEGGGIVDSPTQEQDQYHDEEAREGAREEGGARR